MVVARAGSPWGRFVRVVAFALAYYLLAELSYAAAFSPKGALALWWAPSGLALATLIRASRRSLPWYLGAIILSATIMNASQPITVAQTVYRSIADLLEPMTAALLLRARFGREMTLDRLKEVLAFTALGGVLGPFVGGVTVWIGGLAVSGGVGASSRFALLWFGSAVLGAMLFAPLILTWRTPRQLPRGRRLAEVALLGAVLVLVAIGTVFMSATPAMAALIGFAAFPPLAWAAGRFGPTGTARAAVALSVLSLWPTLTQWFEATPGQIVLSQGIYAFGVLTALSLSALTTETQRLRERAEAQARRAEESLALVENALGEARQAVRVREDFLSIASHELKTPLTPLAARLSFIQRKLETGEAVSSESFRKALASLRKLTDLINDLLDASRIEHGRLMLHLEPQPVQEVVRYGLEPFRGVSAEHRIVAEIPDEPLWVSADRQRLTQVIANLVDNAIKYSPSGGEVRVSIVPLDGAVELIVADQGIGIPAEQLSRLFERFYRAENASISFGGLGLGLYITHDIVVRHGGRIWAESVPGVGSRFHVVLPRIQPAELIEALH